MSDKKIVTHNENDMVIVSYQDLIPYDGQKERTLITSPKIPIHQIKVVRVQEGPLTSIVSFVVNLFNKF